MTRSEVLGQAVDQCMKEIYSYAQPKIDWEAFIEENKVYRAKEKVWENYKNAFYNREKNPEQWTKIKDTFPHWENKSIAECIGPRPFEFYYIPKDILEDIYNSYVYAYNIDSQKQLLDIIELLKNYCKEPIIDKYIDDWTDEHGNHHPGYRSYDHPDNLEKELDRMIRPYTTEIFGADFQSKFFEFLDMAGKFYNWNRNLNSFGMSVYLGASPNSNKEAVIKNWKEYRGQDIKIDEEQIKKEYYGEED